MKIFALAVGASLLAIASPAAAQLTGSQVTATLLYPNLNTTYAGPVTSTVGAGVEFPFGSFNPALGSFDIGANSISFFSNQNGNYGTATFNGYRLDFTNRNISSLTLNGASTFTPNQFYFQNNGNNASVFINVSGQDPQNGNAVFDVASGAVPEPATWALMILGFGAVGSATRRRVRAKVAYA